MNRYRTTTVLASIASTVWISTQTALAQTPETVGVEPFATPEGPAPRGTTGLIVFIAVVAVLALGAVLLVRSSRRAKQP